MAICMLLAAEGFIFFVNCLVDWKMNPAFCAATYVHLGFTFLKAYFFNVLIAAQLP